MSKIRKFKIKCCSKCQKYKSISEFYKHKRHKDGLGSICKICLEEYRKKYYKKNREKILSQAKDYRGTHKENRKNLSHIYYKRNRNRIREYQRKNQTKYTLKKYNITIQEYTKLLNKQNKLCAICNEKETMIISRKLPLIVDHCHEENKIRGLLCSQCNLMLGFARDNLKILYSAIKYLKKEK